MRARLCLFEKGVVHTVAQKLIQTNKDAVKMSKNYFSFQVRWKKKSAFPAKTRTFLSDHKFIIAKADRTVPAGAFS